MHIKPFIRLCFFLIVVSITACVQDSVAVRETCEGDEDCAGRCVAGLCQPTSSTQGFGGESSSSDALTVLLDGSMEQSEMDGELGSEGIAGAAGSMGGESDMATAGSSGASGATGGSSGENGVAGSSSGGANGGGGGNGGMTGIGGDSGASGVSGGAAGSAGESGSGGVSDGAAGSAGESGSGGVSGGAAGSAGESGSGGVSGGGMAGSGGIAGMTGEGGSGDSFGCEVGTQVLADAALMGAYAPSTRINAMNVPANSIDAQNAQCDVVGVQKGSGLSGLLGLLNIELNDFYSDGSPTPIHQILHFANWDAGLRGDEVSDLALNLYDARSNGGTFRVNPESFDEQGEPLTQFEAAIRQCGLVASGEAFPLAPGGANSSVPILGLISLSYPQIKANVTVSQHGVSLSSGRITGYIHRSQLLELVSALQTACGVATPPDYCGQLGSLLSFPPTFTVDSLLAPVMRNYDTYIDPQTGPEGGCALGVCDAISVCLLFESAPVVLAP